MDSCMKVVIFFIIKSFVRYKKNVLLNQTYLFVLRFLYFIMLLNHVNFVLQKQNTWINMHNSRKNAVQIWPYNFDMQS